MKVMMIVPFADGGIAHYAYNLALSLSSANDLLLITSRNFEFRKGNASLEIKPVLFKTAAFLAEHFPWLERETGLPSLFRRIIKLIEYPINTIHALAIAVKRNVDIVHVQTVNLTELLMVVIFRIAGIKVVFTVHNVMPRHEKVRRYHIIFYRMLYGLCDRLIIHSQQGKAEIVQLFSVDPRKISVIPHGDYKFFLPSNDIPAAEAKRNLGIASTCRSLLFFGAIRPNKGLDNLLRALSLIKRQASDVKLLIVGEPCENYSKYRDIIEKEGLHDNVYERLAYVPNEEVARFFFAADVVVLPYNEITQSGVLQIAYAFGKPVVATSIGGFNEAIVDGGNGFLVPPNNIAALAEKIVLLISDLGKMGKMGRHSRYLSDTEFSWESIGNKTVGVYAQALS